MPNTSVGQTPVEQNPNENVHSPQAELITTDQQRDYKILIDLIEDAEAKREILLKMDAIEEIRSAPNGIKQEKVKQWALLLGKHPRTITRMLEKAHKEGLSAIAKATRADSGKRRGSPRWKPSVEYWIEFIEKTYSDGNKHACCLRSSSANWFSYRFIFSYFVRTE